MVKFRNAKICNIKALLMWMVIYGHWIEPYIYDNPHAMIQYRLIYGMHVPAFAMISGLCFRRKSARKAVRKLLPIYGILQTLCWFLGLTPDLWTPCWHLWYLLSDMCWMVMASCVRQKKLWIIGASVGFGITAGFIPWIGRVFSLSRTIVFFPFFYLGVWMKKSWPDRRLGIISAFVAMTTVYPLFRIPFNKLYEADPYMYSQDVVFRLLHYAFGFSTSLSLLFLVPNHRFSWTRAGADTLVPYLVHAPLVAIFRMIPLSLSLSAVVSLLLYCLIERVDRLYQPLFLIRSTTKCSIRKCRGQ